MSRVVNVTKITILATDLKIASSPFDKFLGLLRTSNPRSLLFKTRFGIHTLFIKTPIDVIVLDKKKIVRKIATVHPNKFFFYNPKYSHVLELPRGSIKKSKTEIGDRLTVQ